MSKTVKEIATHATKVLSDHTMGPKQGEVDHDKRVERPSPGTTMFPLTMFNSQSTGMLEEPVQPNVVTNAANSNVNRLTYTGGKGECTEVEENCGDRVPIIRQHLARTSGEQTCRLRIWSVLCNE